MRYVAAYLLATLGGNKNPKADDIKNILSAVGIEADQERLDKVIKELSGKDIDEVLAAGREKLASIPTGGVAAPGGGGAAAAGDDGAKAEEKKEEKKEESEEESDDDMGFGLFD